MSLKPTGKEAPRRSGGFVQTWLPKLAWGVAILMVAFTGTMIFQQTPSVFSAFTGKGPEKIMAATVIPTFEPTAETNNIALPELSPAKGIDAVSRTTNPHTVIPERPRSSVDTYTIQKGDSLFGIAKDYNIKPTTLLWANVDVLNDNPHQMSVGDKLKIPPTDGILYKWKAGDTLEAVAQRFKANVREILTWPGNHLDLLSPQVKPDSYVMVPGGWRETKPWLVPTMWRANSGASRGINGCAAGGTMVGSGYFVWPAGNHYLSGNDYSEIHLGIDIAAGDGAPVYAADSGVVVYAASIGGGYGNMVMIDHGTSYTTLYAHLSSILVKCGQNVVQGARIALAGSTGNSTGPHLHFEVRQNGAFLNPWFVLP